MVGPDFTRPPAKVSPSWMDASGERPKAEPPEYRNWWAVFDDPVLEQLIAQAYQENLSLKDCRGASPGGPGPTRLAAGGLYPQTQQAYGSLQYNRTSEQSPRPVPCLLAKAL